MTEIIAYRPQDAAKAIGCGLTTLYAEIAAGRIAAKKIAGRTLIPVESLRAYVAGAPDATITTGQPLKPNEARRPRAYASRCAA